MTKAEEQLSAIGYGRCRSEPVCWRGERLGRTAQQAKEPPEEPICSPALRHWRELLAKQPLPAAYRISRIAG